MKRQLIFACTLIAVALPSYAPAEEMGAMKKNEMNGMASQKKVVTAQGVGVVKAIDTNAGTVTLAHQAIPALRWPAMTMAFKVARPELLKGLSAGMQVKFDLQGDGMRQTITAIGPVN